MNSGGKAETPLFAKYHDLLAWLAPALEKFPKAQRFLLASRLLDTAFACHAELIRARKVTDAARAQALLQADIHLETLRLQWRLAHELKCVSTGQYEHGARLMDEVGRLLGHGAGEDAPAGNLWDNASGGNPTGAVRLSQQEQSQEQEQQQGISSRQ